MLVRPSAAETLMASIGPGQGVRETTRSSATMREAESECNAQDGSDEENSGVLGRTGTIKLSICAQLSSPLLTTNPYNHIMGVQCGIVYVQQRDQEPN